MSDDTYNDLEYKAIIGSFAIAGFALGAYAGFAALAGATSALGAAGTMAAYW